MTKQSLKKHLSSIATKGGVARALALTPERRRQIAIKASMARWDEKLDRKPNVISNHIDKLTASMRQAYN